MEKRDFYAILGVSRTESAGGIRAAFRKLAKAHHPDLTGPENTRHFQEITEAYCTLSDPAARESYNRTLRQKESRRQQRVTAAGRVRVDRSVVQQPAIDPFSHFDSIFQGLFESVFSSGMHGHRGSEPVDLELILSQREALQGGDLQIPIACTCPFCSGSGRFAFGTCSECRGSGTFESGESVRLHISPRIKDGAVVEIPVQNRRRSSLRILIRVR